jgi:transcriptional regulator GlxA family with amidase domain
MASSNEEISTLSRRSWLGAGLLLGAAASAGCARALEADAADAGRLASPDRPVPTAILLDHGATVIDFAGPWEAFQDAMVAGVPGFSLFTVAPSLEPIRTTPGMGDYGALRVLPDYDFDTAPPARVIVMGAQSAMEDPRKLEWVRHAAASADIVLSVCTGAFLLANTGLLDGLSATTHHDFYERFERRYGDRIRLVRERRFVENGKYVTAGGLTSGVDGALRVVARYYGRQAARANAEYMEHDSQGWMSGERASAA